MYYSFILYKCDGVSLKQFKHCEQRADFFHYQYYFIVSQPMLTCQLHPYELTSVKFVRIRQAPFSKIIWKMPSLFITLVVKITDVVQNIITQPGNVHTRISDMLYRVYYII